jgi:hypothetical protein
LRGNFFLGWVAASLIPLLARVSAQHGPANLIGPRPNLLLEICLTQLIGSRQNLDDAWLFRGLPESDFSPWSVARTDFSRLGDARLFARSNFWFYHKSSRRTRFWYRLLLLDMLLDQKPDSDSLFSIYKHSKR